MTIQLIAIKFIFSKDDDEERIMHSKSDKIEFMSNDDTHEFVNEVFVPLFQDTNLIKNH